MTVPDAVDRGQRLEVGLHDRVEAAQRTRQRRRGRRPGVADAEPDDHPCERTRLGVLDRREQVARRDLAHALEPDELLLGERVEVAGVLHEPGLHQLAHALLAEPLDVHPGATGEVHDLLLALHRAVGAHAAGVGLAVEPDERLVEPARDTWPGTSTSGRRACGRRAPDRPPRG